ncbi:MAG: cell division protein FtsZ [Pseudomonadota bacterium]
MINVRIQTPEVNTLSPKITVLGVGGAGGNAVNNMIQSNLEGCEFIVCNTDAQALEGSLSDKKIQLGTHVTGGLGAGANPEVGKQAAEESLDELMSHLEGANMAFITAGMGGGTGTGAAPVIAKAARDAGVLTVGVVTKPFHFEGTHRMKMAEEGIHEMQDYVDTLIVIPNQNLFRVANEKTTFAEAFKMADSVLQSGVRGVTDLMVNPGIINLDFADIRSAMMEMGKAMMGTGEATGERRAIEAAEAAINNPLLDDVSMKGARGVIINVTGGADIALFEVDEACNRIRDEVDPNANIIFGTSLDERMDGTMRVSVVATGIDAAEAKKTRPSGVKVTSMTRKPLEVPEKPAATAAPTTPMGRAMPASSTSFRSSIPSQPAQPSTAPVVREMTNAVRAAASTASAAAAKMEEPEADMFEQQDLVEQAKAPQPMQPQATAGRGYVQQGQFIPPAPVVPERQTPVAAQAGGFGPQLGGTTPAPQQPQRMGNDSALVLRPPVPGQGAAERKQTPSLFERITGVRKDIMGEDKATETSSGDTSSGGTGDFAGLRASSPSASDAPSQGSLNIDSPSAPKRAEDELDIPAFLRRQAN